MSVELCATLIGAFDVRHGNGRLLRSEDFSPLSALIASRPV
ncbi:MAG TPA: hypothetical protein VNO18_13980 [Xanthobacteraceae bacterium]|jgi:hypothetical protein|nr:hypothetical protein [Xanthobacteraceae bacterium]